MSTAWPSRTGLTSAGLPLRYTLTSSWGARKSSSIGPSTVSWARRHKASTNFTCAPTAPIKLSKTFEKRLSRRNAAPAERPARVSTFQTARRDGRRQVQRHPRLPRRRAHRSRGGKRRDPLPCHDHRIFLRARAVSYLAQEQLRQKHRAIAAQAGRASAGHADDLRVNGSVQNTRTGAARGHRN